MLQDDLNQYDYGARFYDPVIARMTSVDPHSENYLRLSPYNYVAGNPINSSDLDGKDLIVLTAPNNVGGLGHAAVLIGNDQTGWDLYSKNGTTNSSGASGPSNLDLNIGVGTGYHYKTLYEFNRGTENLRHGVTQYKEGYRLTTNSRIDDAMRKKAREAVLSTYMVLGQSCIDVASEALEAGNFNPGTTSYGIVNNWVNWFIPNLRYNRIKTDNPQGEVVKFINYFPLGIAHQEREGKASLDLDELKKLDDIKE